MHEYTYSGITDSEKCMNPIVGPERSKLTDAVVRVRKGNKGRTRIDNTLIPISWRRPFWRKAQIKKKGGRNFP